MLTLAALGFQEILIFGLILFLFFGARKLPELARSIGSSVNEFKKGLKDGGENDGGSGKDQGPPK